MRKLWNALRRPSARWSVLALVAIGIVIGIALIVLPHVGIKVTSTTEFCVSCHSMQPVYEEYKQSVHFQNASGVRAECHDCHIPPDIPVHGEAQTGSEQRYLPDLYCPLH